MEESILKVLSLFLKIYINIKYRCDSINIKGKYTNPILFHDKINNKDIFCMAIYNEDKSKSSIAINGIVYGTLNDDSFNVIFSDSNIFNKDLYSYIKSNQKKYKSQKSIKKTIQDECYIYLPLLLKNKEDTKTEHNILFLVLQLYACELFKL